MDDRFKFRTPIFDEEGKFLNFYFFDILAGCDGYSDVGPWEIGKAEQCTGLKDKNGRLIYEGDIIQHDTAAGPKCWPVVFKNGCFVLPYDSGDAWLGKVIEHCPYDSGVVIVGNIHENPELLEADK